MQIHWVLRWGCAVLLLTTGALCFDEVAHNYCRDHEWNMWFVLACESREKLEQCFASILDQTSCPGMNLPKEREYFVGLHLDV